MKFLDKLNKNEKMLLLAIGALVLIWVIYNLIIGPFYKNWAQLDKNIEIAKIELEKSVKIFKEKEKVAEEYNKYVDRFTIKESEDEEMALILNEIETQASNSLVRIINMKPRRAQKSGIYSLFYVDLDTEATMPNMLKFVKKLKDSKFSLCVEQLTLNSRTSEPSVLSGTMVVSRLGINSKETPQNR